MNLSVSHQGGSRRKAPPQRLVNEDASWGGDDPDGLKKAAALGLPPMAVFPGADKAFAWHAPQRDLNYNSLFPVMSHLLVPKAEASPKSSPKPRSTPQGQKSRKGLVHVSKGTYYSADHPHIVRQDGPPRTYSCRLCNLTFKTFRIACDHLRGIHENTYMYFCNVCGESFKWRSTLRTHKLKTPCGNTDELAKLAAKSASPAQPPASSSPAPMNVASPAPSSQRSNSPPAGSSPLSTNGSYQAEPPQQMIVHQALMPSFEVKSEN
jgi:hypothetical protein